MEWLIKLPKIMFNIKKLILKHLSKIVILVLLGLLPVYIYSKNILSWLNTHIDRMNHKNPLKIAVFDLDETLGYFTEISIFWDALENYYGRKLTNQKFFEVLDTFPEVFRPNIFKILDFIHKKKSCHKIFIYTNNQGEKSWVGMISDYISYKNGYNVFDHIIAAYKIRGKLIEPKRTSHDKSVKDLISCTNIPENTEICFIDDLYHPLMEKENVYYINIKQYRISLPFDEMAKRYYHAILKNTDINSSEFINKMVTYMKQYNYMVLPKSDEEKRIDTIVSKKLFSNLDDFFKKERTIHTRKRVNKHRKTIRH